MSPWPARAHLAVDLLVVLLAAIFLLLLATSMSTVLEGLASNSDLSTAWVIAETMRTPVDGRQITLGDSPWYEPIWLMRATSWLPGRWTIWPLIPFTLWATGIVLAFTVVRRALGSLRLGLLTAALIAVPGLSMQAVQWGPNVHGVVTVHLLIVLAMATAALLDPRWMHGRRLVGALAIGGAIAAVGAVDQQFVIYGLAPLLAMAAYVAVQQRAWRPFLVAAGFTLIALVGRTLLVRAGEAAQIVPTGRVFNFVGVDRVATQLGMFPGAVGELIVSNVWGAPMRGPQPALWMLAAFVAVGAIVAVLIAGSRRLWSAARPVIDAVRADPESDLARPTTQPPEARHLTQDALLVFAGVSALLAIAIWATAGVVFDLTAGRYIAPVWVAVCVALPILGVRTRTEPVISIAVAVIVLAATWHFHDRRSQALPNDPQPTIADATAIQRFAAEHGVTRGYGAYWASAAITWHARFKVRVYPVKGCGAVNCPYGLGTASDWYLPKGGPTLLVTDSTPNQPTVDPRYGKPIAEMQQRGMKVRVYAGDIADHIER